MIKMRKKRCLMVRVASSRSTFTLGRGWCCVPVLATPKMHAKFSEQCVTSGHVVPQAYTINIVQYLGLLLQGK